MSPNFKQTHDSVAKSNPFQHYHNSGNAPTYSYGDSEVDEFCRERQSLVDQTPNQDILWLYKVTGTRQLKMHKKIMEKFVDLSAIRRPMTEGSSS